MTTVPPMRIRLPRVNVEHEELQSCGNPHEMQGQRKKEILGSTLHFGRGNCTFSNRCCVTQQMFTSHMTAQQPSQNPRNGHTEGIAEQRR